jgi:hypothetical protein
MNSGDWWWDTEGELPAGAMIVPVICASQKTHWTNFSGDHHSWPLYLMIGNIQNIIRWTHKKRGYIRVGLILCPAKGTKNIVEAWRNAVGTVLSQCRHLEITGPGLKWDCADGFKRQCYPPLASWVRDCLQPVIVAQVSYGSYPMCEIPNGALMGHSAFRPLNHLRDRHIFSELLEDNDIDALRTLSVRQICNQFWQYPLCNVYRLWQPDELHQLLLGLVQDVLHWLLKYLKARNVKNRFDN